MLPPSLLYQPGCGRRDRGSRQPRLSSGVAGIGTPAGALTFTAERFAMAKFEMDTEFVRKLAQILHETDLGEIELADGDRRIRVARPAVTVAGAPVAASAPAASSPAAAAAAAAANDLGKHPGAVK